MICEFDTVKNTVSRFGLVLDEDSNRCGQSFDAHCTTQHMLETKPRSASAGNVAMLCVHIQAGNMGGNQFR